MRTISRSLRVPEEIDLQIQRYSEEMNCSALSKTYYFFIELGLRIHGYRDKLTPELKKKVEEEFSKLRQEQFMLEEAKKLSDSQIEGLQMLMELEREGRLKKIGVS